MKLRREKKPSSHVVTGHSSSHPAGCRLSPSLPLTVLAVALSSGFSAQVLAHAEHDKPRYIAADGRDAGQCDNRLDPCRSFAYVSKTANKGDQILVASGQYVIEDVDALFPLLSNIIPVKPGFSRKNNFAQQDVTSNKSYLTGVPLAYIEELQAKGFHVNHDQKALSKPQLDVLNAKLAQVASLAKQQQNVNCINGKAGDFSCNNIDLIAHVPLDKLGTGSNAANDIWGFVDLNDHREYAIIGLRKGISVVDVTHPAAPRVVGSIASDSTTWRDIKVFQYFDTNAKRFKAYGYVTADSASVGLMIIDLTDLPNQATLANIDKTDISAHNVYLSNVDYTTGLPLNNLVPYLHIVGTSTRGGAFNSYSLQNPIDPHVIFSPEVTARRYTHDAASMVIDDDRVSNQCSPQNGLCEIFFDFNEGEMLLWDKTNNTSPTLLSETTYPNAAYVHSGWWSEDKMVVLVHDELDERAHGLNTTLRLFELSDLHAPSLLSIWTGPTAAIDHNGFVRGSRYYMSNYERGLTVLDISNPSLPKEVGFFDTFPISDEPNFNGAWGVYPYLPSGNILVSDVNSGLYILKDNTTGQSQQDSVRFSQSFIDTEEGQQVVVTVKRNGNSSKAVRVHYETQFGSAGSDDFSLATASDSGVLSWAAGDSADKTLTINITPDNLDQEPYENLTVRLFNPQNGLSLAAPSMTNIIIKGVPEPTVTQFTQQTLEVKETDGVVAIEVTSQGNFHLATSAHFAGVDGSALINQDYSLTAGSLTWGVREKDNKTIQLTIINDDVSETNETFQVALSPVDGSGNPQVLNIVIRDDESNLAPMVTSSDTIAGVAGKVVNLVATATDPEGFALSYLWRQVSGNNVNLINPTNRNASFVAPSSAATLLFELQVSDDFAKTTTQQVTVNVAVATTPTTPTTPTNGGGGGSGSLLTLFGLAGLLRTRRWLTQRQS